MRLGYGNIIGNDVIKCVCILMKLRYQEEFEDKEPIFRGTCILMNL